MSETRTFREARIQVAALAMDAFAFHELSETGPNEWRCAKPGTSTHAFVVLLRPGVVAVWGDLGEYILRHSDQDSMGWLRGAVRSTDYLIEKLRASDGPKKEFYPGDALAWLHEGINDEGASTWTRGAMRQVLDQWNPEAGPDAWGSACLDAGLDDPVDGMNFSSGALWLAEALKVFVRLHDTLKPSEAPTRFIVLPVEMSFGASWSEGGLHMTYPGMDVSEAGQGRGSVSPTTRGGLQISVEVDEDRRHTLQIEPKAVWGAVKRLPLDRMDEEGRAARGGTAP